MVHKFVPASASGAAGYRVFYGFDLRGLQTKAAFDGIAGAGVSNAYDAFGRLVSTTTSLGGVSRTVSHLHDRDGLESEMTFPDGQKFWTARDGLGRPAGLYHDPLGSTSTRLVAFAWDPASRLSRLTRYPGDRTDYGYGRWAGIAVWAGIARLSLHPARCCRLSAALVVVRATAESRPGREI